MLTTVYMQAHAHTHVHTLFQASVLAARFNCSTCSLLDQQPLDHSLADQLDVTAVFVCVPRCVYTCAFVTPYVLARKYQNILNTDT